MKKSKKQELNFFGLNLTLVLFWMGVIFYFSSLQGQVPISEPPLTFYIQRKGAHIGEYFILMILLINLLRDYIKSKKEVIFVSGVLVLFYATTDEIHQLFVFGREGKITDILFDLTGIFLASLAFWIFYKQKKSLFQKK